MDDLSIETGVYGEVPYTRVTHINIIDDLVFPDTSHAWNKCGVIDCPQCGSDEHTMVVPNQYCSHHNMLEPVWYCDRCNITWEYNLLYDDRINLYTDYRHGYWSVLYEKYMLDEGDSTDETIVQ